MSINVTLGEVKTQEVANSCDNRCPDYDEDCVLVKDHVQCFLGLPTEARNGIIYCTGQAKGYCPFVQTKN